MLNLAKDKQITTVIQNTTACHDSEKQRHAMIQKNKGMPWFRTAVTQNTTVRCYQNTTACHSKYCSSPSCYKILDLHCCVAANSVFWKSVLCQLLNSFQCFAGLQYLHLHGQAAFSDFLIFWRRNYFFLILAHTVYTMWVIQEPNML